MEDARSPREARQARLFGISGAELLADPAEPRLGPFQRHSTTSRQAAIENYPRGGTQRRRIIDALAAALTGLTREELSDLLEMPLNSVLPRVVELRTGGWIEEPGRTRRTKQGAKAKVLVLTEQARAELARRDADRDGGDRLASSS